MNKNKLLDALEIRYVQLCFRIAFRGNTILPQNKTSALRGGMGQMLLQQHCIRDRKCAHCDFESECLVRRTMYSRFEIQPGFAGQGDSIGYVIECENRQEQFRAGEQMEFRLLLFGKTIVYFSQFLQAFYQLGFQGLGKYHAQYEILCVTNQNGTCVVDGMQVYPNCLEIGMIRSYVEQRQKQLQRKGCLNQVIFHTPVTLKYEGEFLRSFHEKALYRSILRRIYSFDCFEGREVPLYSMDECLPVIACQHTEPSSVKRYSSTSASHMELRGILGDMTFEGLDELQLLVLLAGEKLHIGKNTSFGFGRYTVQ